MATSSLQVAQILADLQTLQNADPLAAFALLHANKTISPALIRRKSSKAAGPGPSPSPKRTPLSSTTNLTTNTRPPVLASLSSHSSISFTTSKSRQDSGIQTPMRSSSIYETDPDMARAKTLTELYKMRGKVQEMGDTGLARAKARVDGIVAKNAEVELADRERRVRERHMRI